MRNDDLHGEHRDQEIPQAITRDILRERYAGPGEKSIAQVRERVAAALARAELPNARSYHRERFAWALDAGFIPGGRINAGAGFDGQRTLINCFVQPIGDSSETSRPRPGVQLALAQALYTMRCGGGVGYNFSHLRPSCEQGLAHTGGPLECLRLFDDRCLALTRVQARRGAQMAVLNVEHPDIFEFIAAKRRPNRFTTFNFSVGISDRFMRAVLRDDTFELVHAALPGPNATASAAKQRADGLWVYREVRARSIWNALTRAAYDVAEPGVLFLDNINRENNLSYCEQIEATNPCGEQPLPDYGCCCLGSLNLPAFVLQPFTRSANLDIARLEAVTEIAIRMLDNVLDVTLWPLPEQRREGLSKRRIGLGVTGLGDALLMMNLRYDSAQARHFAASVLGRIRDTAYRQSVELAVERGGFPLLDAHAYLRGSFTQTLPRTLRDRIREVGIRNSHLISIAPAGTISLAFADNVSNGIEPPFAWRCQRRHRNMDGVVCSYTVEDHAYRLYRAICPGASALPAWFEQAWDIDALDHVRMAAVLARYVDAGISKTINVPCDYPFEDFQDLYRLAWQWGLKGITTFRPNPVSGAVLTRTSASEQCDAPHCSPLL